jgi:hypothetical protein
MTRIVAATYRWFVVAVRRTTGTGRRLRIDAGSGVTNVVRIRMPRRPQERSADP